MSLTRYAMRGFEFGEELFGVPALPVPGLFQALADAFASVGAGGDIEQALIGLGILHDSRGPAFDREHHRPLALFELLHKIARTPAEGSQRLNVLGDVDHGGPLTG